MDGGPRGAMRKGVLRNRRNPPSWGNQGNAKNVNRAAKPNAAAWATDCLRQLEARGDIVRGTPAGIAPRPTGPQWTYVSVERMKLYLESSLQKGTQWVVFEPNGEPLWGQIRLDVGAFMQGLFVQGVFQGATPQQAYFMKCDADNNTQATMAQGVVNITVGFAPLYPAEFVVIPISQWASAYKPPGNNP